MVFTKHAGNPVLLIGAGGSWESAHVYSQTVIYRNNKWYMYYNGYNGTTIKIGLATSKDGITWTKHAGNPVLSIGAGGSWDSAHVYCPTVIYRNNKWYMYYNGHNGTSITIGLATSKDGITWTKHAGNPVLTLGAGGSWDSRNLYYPSVLYRNNKWYIYYTGYNGSINRIGFATSKDGITWTKYSGNPVLTLGAAGTWDVSKVTKAKITYRNHKWYMYYSGDDNTNERIGLATSEDGINWTKHPDNPLLNLGTGGTWDNTKVYYPSVLYRNHKWYVYYTGLDTTANQIGLATSPSGV